MYFGSINHQDNSCPGFPAAKSGTAALLMVFQGVDETFHRKTGRQISVPVFQIIQKLSLSLKF